MPITLPNLDNRRYQQLLDEALARVPVHTPEWTNFNKSDPGVTLVELFAFFTENLLYRANQIPERNRRKFLQLLGIPLQPASAAQGLVTIQNERGPMQTVTLNSDLELRAGQIPFRTELGLDVLPVEAAVYFKRPLKSPPAELIDYYKLLYASYQVAMPTELNLYESVALDGRTVAEANLGQDTVDGSLWIGIFARKNDKPEKGDDPWKYVREAIAGRVLTLGIVPAVAEVPVGLAPARTADMQNAPLLTYEMPAVASDGKVPLNKNHQPAPTYKHLTPRTEVDLLSYPGVVQLALPDARELVLWRDLDPLEAGVGDLPPALEDAALSSRLITWIRVRRAGTAGGRILWAGINAVPVSQRTKIVSEPLADGNGQPDQLRKLSRAPVLLGSVRIVSISGEQITPWSEIDDLMSAGAEVVRQDFRQPPGCQAENLNPSDVFAVDSEAGTVKFGDGLRGRRPQTGAKLYASYDFSVGAAGNLGKNAIDSSPQLPSGFSVSNPVRTWGGADAETVDAGEKQIQRYLQHRDRLVSIADFESIAYRTPGLELGRVEVLPAFHPDLSVDEPGSAPGVVTLMVIPQHDPEQPDAPRPDRLFLNRLCRYLEPRRLVTTELVLRGPVYKPLWVSLGIEVVAGAAIAEVIEAVKQRLKTFLAPIKQSGLSDNRVAPSTPAQAEADRGWPLRMAVNARVLMAEASRVAGVSAVNEVLLAEGKQSPLPKIEMKGLQLPRVIGISVVVGEPASLDTLRGQATPERAAETAGKSLLPVPTIPEVC